MEDRVTDIVRDADKEVLDAIRALGDDQCSNGVPMRPKWQNNAI